MYTSKTIIRRNPFKTSAVISCTWLDGNPENILILCNSYKGNTDITKAPLF
jgi:hypothetical protein